VSVTVSGVASTFSRVESKKPNAYSNIDCLIAIFFDKNPLGITNSGFKQLFFRTEVLMTLHTILFYILSPICAAVLLGKTLVEFHKKRRYTKYLIQFICFIVFILVGVLMK
jgi:hypothetical protein